jgi:hypothetical protein
MSMGLLVGFVIAHPDELVAGGQARATGLLARVPLLLIRTKNRNGAANFRLKRAFQCCRKARMEMHDSRKRRHRLRPQSSTFTNF